MFVRLFPSSVSLTLESFPQGEVMGAPAPEQQPAKLQLAPMVVSSGTQWSDSS